MWNHPRTGVSVSHVKSPNLGPQAVFFGWKNMRCMFWHLFQLWKDWTSTGPMLRKSNGHVWYRKIRQEYSYEPVCVPCNFSRRYPANYLITSLPPYKSTPDCTILRENLSYYFELTDFWILDFWSFSGIAWWATSETLFRGFHHHIQGFHHLSASSSNCHQYFTVVTLTVTTLSRHIGKNWRHRP